MDKRQEAWEKYIAGNNALSVELEVRTKMHYSFDAGYNVRSQEVSHLRELLRRALPLVWECYKRDSLEDEIEAELKKE